MSPDSDVDICILVGVIKDIGHSYVGYTIVVTSQKGYFSSVYNE